MDAWFADGRVQKKYKDRMRQLFSQMDHIMRMMQQEKRAEVDPSSISEEVAEAMLRNGIAEVIPEDDKEARPNTTVFLIPEEKKQRFRVIHWTRFANEAAVNHYRWNHKVAQQADVLDYIPLVWSAAFGATFDLKASFYQIELPKELRNLFVFRVGNRTMRMVRLPMGFSLSCEILQIFTQSLAEVVADLVRSNSHQDLLTFTHVDNFLFLSNSAAAVREAIKHTAKITNDWNVTLSESATEPTDFIKFHALQLNLCAKEVSMTPESIGKIQKSLSTLRKSIQTGKQIVSMAIIQDMFECEPLLKICARLTYWSRVMFRGSNWKTGDLASHFPVMNLIRAAGTLLQKGKSTINVNRQCIIQMIEWFEMLPNKIAVPKPMANFQQVLEIITDASTTGGGYIIQGHPMAFPWPQRVEPKNMGEAELEAILQALRAIPRSHAVRIITDSNIAIGGITHGYSASLRVNEVVRKILRILRERNIILTELRYIDTELNPADPLSRATDLRRLRIITSVPLAWEWEERAYSLSQDGGALLSYPIPVVGPDGTLRAESTV